MGEKDLAQKTLEAYNDVFADIVNVLLFDGKQLVKEDELEQESPESIYKVDGKLHELKRDVAKYWKHNNIRIALVGLENQIETDKYMPIRVMSYDATAYRQQLLNQYEIDPETGKQVKKKNADHIYPVVTMVLYFGNIPWKKYKTLLDIVEVPEELKPFVSDYKTNIFEIAWLSKEQVELFKSDFKIVADYFVQMRTNKDYKPSQQIIKHVNEVLQLMSVFTNDNTFEEYQNLFIIKGEEVTMSGILDKAEARGEARGKLDLLYKLIKNGMLTVEQAAKSINISVEQLLANFKQYNLIL
ncbi:MAG: Rpn family recombination-promoting nuclease/putative transposase [Candidatus Riflebacteria bacterium]|nr:Rpn family recombination-promoting nuclease/putative transposase [Candidatus Riflebacteria bacterium]